MNNMKKNKKIISLILAMALSLTSCVKNESNCNEYKDNVKKIIADNGNGNPDNRNRSIDEFFYNFINLYGNYLNQEQYDNLIEMMSLYYMDQNISLHDNTIKLLNEMTNSYDDVFGRGLGRAFSLRLIYEGIFPSWMYRDEVYDEFNTLRSVVNDDESFYSCLFSSDMEGLIECIETNTGLPKEQARELILLIDSYSDIKSSEDYNDLELKETYTTEIKRIMCKLVQSKLKKDEKFSKTILGQLLSKSEYNGNYQYNVTNNLFDDVATINGFKETFMYTFSVPSYLLKTNKTISEIKELAVYDIISKGDNENNSYEYDAMSFMIHLIDPNTLNKINLTPQEIRTIIYANLKEDYEMFEDSNASELTTEDYDDFFLLIANGSSMVFYDYFSLFEKRLLIDGITYEDFVRFTSLANFIRENERVTIDWNYDMDYPPYDEIKRMKEDEYNKTVRSYSSNELLDGMDYKMCMGMSYDIIKDNDLGYEQLYSPNCEYSYSAGQIIVSVPSPSVTSAEVPPSEGNFFGNTVIYYEVPENYENGRAVECFYNIERKLTMVEVPGIFKTIYDPEKGRDITIFICDIDASLNDDTPSIRFTEYYDYYKEMVDNKKLTLEEK